MIHFLVVESDPEFAENIRELVAHGGFAADHATSAADARALAERKTFDVVLVDQGLPDGRGVDLIAELRTKAPLLMAVVLSAQPTVQSARDAILSGAAAFVPKDGDPRELEALIRRTAEQAGVAQALRESDARYTTLVERAPLGIALVRDGRYLFANESYVHIYGFSTPTEVIGRPVESVYHEDERASVRERWREGQTWRESYTVTGGRRADGRRIDVSIMRSPFELEGRRAVQLLVRDVTEETRLAGELEEARGQVEEKRRLAALGEMVAGIAHEIRNPLQGVSWGLVELKELCRTTVPPAGALEALAKIERSTHEIEAIVAQVLDFAKPLKPDRIPFLVQDILDSTREDLLPLAADAKVLLVAERRDAPDEVLVDAVKLKQALVNLVRNAIEASPPGGRVVLRATGGRAETDPVVFEVEDEGPGIPEHMRERVYLPFVTTKVKGTGLGLAITRRIVEVHGGTIVLEERRPRGTRARVSLSAATRIQR